MTAPEPVLDVHDIQGNILAGFNKDVQILAGLQIVDVGAAKRWISSIHKHIASTREVLQFNRAFRSVRLRTGAEPIGMSATWCNIAFSRQGIEKLTSRAEADALPDDAFRIGMPARAGAILGDPLDPASKSHPRNWKVGATGNIPDVLLIVASDQQVSAVQLIDTLLGAEDMAGMNLLYRETGNTLPELPGHEHFGYKDGISQPGVRGRASVDEEDFITPRMIDPEDPLSANFSRPGQPLIMPGHFVLGYHTQDAHSGAPVDPRPLAHAWFRNGSFLVFRRLRQDVFAFRRFIEGAALTLSQQPGLASMTADLLGAAFVGRWPNGSSLVRAPNAPDPVMETETAANAFAFSQPMPSVRMRGGFPPDASPLAPADPLAVLCPHWAHIRKVNPRDEQTNLGNAFDTLTRRLMRRGIPYGPPAAPGAMADDGIDRGLLFLAYHTSLKDSFERLVQDWTNQVFNPASGGHDPIMGQTNADGRRRVVSVQAKDGSMVDLPIDQEWVMTTGGGYFFAPSLSAIGGRLAT